MINKDEYYWVIIHYWEPVNETNIWTMADQVKGTLHPRQSKYFQWRDLDLRWAHMYEGIFPDVVAPFVIIISFWIDVVLFYVVTLYFIWCLERDVLRDFRLFWVSSYLFVL